MKRDAAQRLGRAPANRRAPRRRASARPMPGPPPAPPAAPSASKLETSGGGSLLGQCRRQRLGQRRARSRIPSPGAGFTRRPRPGRVRPAAPSPPRGVGTRSPRNAARTRRRHRARRSSRRKSNRRPRRARRWCGRAARRAAGPGNRRASAWTSNSTQRAPSCCASLKAGERVLGRAPAAPRWPMIRGQAPAPWRRGSEALVQGAALAVSRCRRSSASLALMSSPVAWSTCFMLSLTLPRSSKPSTLTFTWSPTLTTSVDLADALRRQLADMDEPVARAEEIDEGAEIDGLHHLAVIDHAELRARRRCRGSSRSPRCDGVGVDRRDLDRAVVLDVDLGAGRPRRSRGSPCRRSRSLRGSCPWGW